jgi:hypothetical protein
VVTIVDDYPLLLASSLPKRPDARVQRSLSEALDVKILNSTLYATVPGTDAIIHFPHYASIAFACVLLLYYENMSGYNN